MAALAQVLELVDKLDLGSSVLSGVRVRLSPWAPFFTHQKVAQSSLLREDSASCICRVRPMPSLVRR